MKVKAKKFELSIEDFDGFLQKNMSAFVSKRF